MAGQPLNRKLADIIYDPFNDQEKTETFGELLAHFPSTLVDPGGTFRRDCYIPVTSVRLAYGSDSPRVPIIATPNQD